MNEIYIYPNSFIELLNLIKILFDKKIRPYNIKNKDYNPGMFDKIINLEIKDDDKIINEFVQIFGKDNIQIIYYIFISNEENKEVIIYYYLLNYFKYHENLFRMRNLKCVSEALRISKKVSNENHRLKGFTRFRELQNKVLYAEVNPDNDILHLLGIHFKRRLSNEYFIIKDVNRNMFCIYDKKDIYLVLNKNNISFNNISKDENEFAKMWQDFYQTIGIEMRKNDRCRMNFMPKKYWDYILEVKGEL